MAKIRTSAYAAYQSYFTRKPASTHWVITSWRQNPDKLDIQAMWNSHREDHALRIPCLNREALQRLAEIFIKGGVPGEISELAAENITCEYLEDLEAGLKEPRNSQVSQEAEKIKEAADELSDAMTSASRFTLWNMEEEFSHIVRSHPGTLESEWSPLFFRRGAQFHEVDLNPHFIEALSYLCSAAKCMARQVPEDKGGAASGLNDRAGQRAKLRVVLTARCTLKELGLPSGCHKYGAVSDFANRVHEAAKGEFGCWGNDYASKVPQLEKRLQEQVSREQGAVGLPDGEHEEA